jgi:hypothetical protein
VYDPRNPTPHRPNRRPNHPSPGNAFTPAFLDLLDPEDDPPTATEALAEGPWTVVRVAAPKLPFADSDGAAANQAEPWAVVREGDRPDAEPPAATFVHLHPARLATAALPVASRDGVYRLDRDPDPRGFALRQDGRLVGHLPWHHQELVVALRHLDALARSPRALAAVLEAAGASALRRVGALLAGRSA